MCPIKRSKVLKYCKIILSVGAVLSIVISLSCFVIGSKVKATAKPYIYASDSVPFRYTGMVLGAHVGKDGTPSLVLADRLNTALSLYHKGKFKRFLLTGDHGRKTYDEVNNMKRYLMEQGVPECDIFLDHAGFDTYSSMVRAKEVFQVKDVIVIT